MIRIFSLVVRYADETALEDIDLQIDKNSTCAVIGHSGCGKTTLLLALSGLIAPDKGRIFIDGQAHSGVRKETGIILQNLGLLPWKTVWNNVALGLVARNAHKDAIEKRVASILLELGILDQKDKYPSQLSGGQKQRVAIARTLVLQPDLLPAGRGVLFPGRDHTRAYSGPDPGSVFSQEDDHGAGDA